MRIAELIAVASIRSGKSKGQLAAEMGHTDATRIAKIGAGKTRPSAGEIVYLAGQAKTDAIRALAEIESEREPRFATAWNQALSAVKS